jgi:hypothetical protein
VLSASLKGIIYKRDFEKHGDQKYQATVTLTPLDQAVTRLACHPNVRINCAGLQVPDNLASTRYCDIVFMVLIIST